MRVYKPEFWTQLTSFQTQLSVLIAIFLCSLEHLLELNSPNIIIMKAFIAVFLFAASANAGLLGSNIAYTTNAITYAAAPLASSYQYNYRYAQPTYYTVAAAPAVQTVAVAKQVVQAPTIVRQVATAPVVATVKAAPVAVQVAQPVVKTVAVAAPVVKTIAAAPVAYAVQPSYAVQQAYAPLTYTYPSYAPYYGSYILKK